MFFGPRSEKMPPSDRALRGAPKQPPEGKSPCRRTRGHGQHALDRQRRAKGKAGRKRQRTRRKKDMPVVESTLEVANEDLPEGTTWDDFRPTGTASPAERVAYVPGRIVRHRDLRKTLVHRDADSRAGEIGQGMTGDGEGR